MNPEIIEKIKDHYNHVREKHPYFCDGLLPTQVSSDWSKGEVLQKIVLELRLARERIEVGGKIGNLLWNEVLNCEVWEATAQRRLGSHQRTKPLACGWENAKFAEKGNGVHICGMTGIHLKEKR